MKMHGFADVRQFRVKLPEPLYPYYGKIEVCDESDLSLDAADWLGLDVVDDRIHCFTSNFSCRNPLNIPGPFYGAETDTCETGPEARPSRTLGNLGWRGKSACSTTKRFPLAEPVA